MDGLQFIVSRLNKAPFNMNLRLVEFDEKSQIELLQVLNDVLSTMDSDMTVDVRLEVEQARSSRIARFLQILKYKHIPEYDEERREWLVALGNGVKDIIYPILHWVLVAYDNLCKRVYLARYLLPIEIPIELTIDTQDNDPILSELATTYKELQEDFKAVHKHFETTKVKSTTKEAEHVKSEIEQLENERSELREKIDSLQLRNKSETLFPNMLNATSGLRSEQDKELRLHESLQEQQKRFSIADKKKNEILKRLKEIEERRSINEFSVDVILERLQTECQEMNKFVKTDLVSEKANLEETILKFMNERHEPMKTEEDLQNLTDEVKHIEIECKRLEQELEEKQKTRKDNKLALFKKQASLVHNKRSVKNKELSEKKKELIDMKMIVEGLEIEANELIATITTSNSTASGATNEIHMTHDDFKAFGNKHRENNKLYNQTKQKLTNLQAESDALQRTEQILQERYQTIEENLKQEEDNAGVTGYRNIQSKLELASEDTAESDEIKGQMLEEISQTINNIQKTLSDKQRVLRPKIEVIKKIRKENSDLELEYLERKHKYEKVSMKLNNETQLLMKECEKLKNDWIDEERQYYYLLSTNQILESKRNKVNKEDEIRLLQLSPSNNNNNPEAAVEENIRYRAQSSLVELYKEKLTQQENLAKQLRKNKRDIKENETTNLHQRAMFSDLRDLLKCKIMTKKQQQQKSNSANGHHSSIMGGSDGKISNSCDELLAEAIHIGGAQVISFD